MVATTKWALLVGTGVIVAAVSSAAPAAADPVSDPCQLGVTFLCRFMPIAPGLDHDIDLTQGPGTLNGESMSQMPAGQNPEDVPPAPVCDGGCT